MTSPILVTGATGNVGREVVRVLTAGGVPLRAGVRTVEEGRGILGAGIDAVPLDFTNPATFGPALQGMKGLFLLRPPPIADVKTTLNVLVDEAARSGVEHVVFLSVAGAGENSIVPHHAVEEHLKRTRIGWTFLRPGFFAQNLADAYRRDIAEDDRIYVPAARGRVTFVDVRDVAEVAANCFVDLSSHGQAFTLTGPEPVTFDEVVALLSKELGRRIRYVPASVLGYVRHLRRRRQPWPQVIVQTILHVGLRFGQAEKVDPTLEKLLGRRPRTMATFVHDHAGLWRRA